jgi:hypothetical protein
MYPYGESIAICLKQIIVFALLLLDRVPVCLSEVGMYGNIQTKMELNITIFNISLCIIYSLQK